MTIIFIRKLTTRPMFLDVTIDHDRLLLVGISIKDLSKGSISILHDPMISVIHTKLNLKVNNLSKDERSAIKEVKFTDHTTWFRSSFLPVVNECRL